MLLSLLIYPHFEIPFLSPFNSSFLILFKALKFHYFIVMPTFLISFP